MATSDLTDAPDDDLVRRIQEDGPDVDEAFKVIDRRYSPRVRAYLGRLGVKYDNALDIWQHVLFAMARRQFRGFDPARGTLLGYLRRAAYHRWVSANRPGIASEQTGAAERLERLPSPESAEADAASMGDRIRETLPHLPPRQRRVMELVLQGRTYPELEQELGLSAKVLYGLKNRAMEHLAKRLNLTLPPPTRGRPKGARSPDADL